MAIDYSEYGLDSKLQKTDAPFSQVTYEDAYKVSSQYDQIQTKTLIASNLAVSDMIKQISTYQTTFDFSESSTVYADVVNRWIAPLTNSKMFSKYYVSVYQGTTASRVWQIYPYIGGSVVAAGDALRYKIQNDNDWHTWSNGGGTDTPYAADRHVLFMLDTNGTNSDSHFLSIDSNYVDYLIGNAT